MWILLIAMLALVGLMYWRLVYVATRRWGDWDAPTVTRPALTAAGTVALFDNAALREFAQALVDADTISADYLIDALIDALEMPHDDVDVDEQLRVTQ